MTSSEQIANSLAALSVAITFGATVMALLLAAGAVGYGVFLRRWIKQEAHDGAAEFLRSPEGHAALRKIAAAEIASTAIAPPLIVPSGRDR